MNSVYQPIKHKSHRMTSKQFCKRNKIYVYHIYVIQKSTKTTSLKPKRLWLRFLQLDTVTLPNLPFGLMSNITSMTFSQTCSERYAILLKEYVNIYVCTLTF